jgi:hypothetical protein
MAESKALNLVPNLYLAAKPLEEIDGTGYDTASKAGSNGRIRVNSGYGHPI